MDLIIVESPTKAKTISKFLGKDYQVESSFGHIRDLPKSEMGIDIENNFAPHYIIPAKSRKAVNKLKKLSKEADKVILATDEDREGEAIAWHLVKALDIPESKRKRIVFHEITKNAITEALKEPQGLDEKMVDAQQARRVLDRLVGYELSPFLWKKVARGLSAGRVQSVAVRMIVEREREIEKFKPEEYWDISADLETEEKKGFSARLNKIKDKTIGKMDIKNEKQAQDILKSLEKAAYVVDSIEKKKGKKNPPGPFITSTLQQTANRWLGFSAKQTMMIAQQLYEGIEIKGEDSQGLITYMRTDSMNLSQKFLDDAQEYLKNNFDKKYTTGKARRFKTKSKGAQEAHEAIRPTEVMRSPESLKGSLNSNQFKLYKLIWQRALASQMPEAIIDATTIDINAEGTDYQFRANGQILEFDGYLKVYPEKSTELQLPEVKKDDKLDLKEIKKEQHFTKPPARYSDAGLVKELEKHGIGRPSTYAPTIATITARNYVERDENKKLKPTEIAMVVNDLLTKHFSEIVDLDFTAEMEDDLDLISEGKKEWQPIIKNFYEPFHKNLEKKQKEVKKDDIMPVEETDEVCDKCGKPMVIKTGRYGKFLACSGFPECKNVKSLDENGQVEEKEKSENLEKLEKKYEGQVCEKCGEKMVIKNGRYGPFLACSGFPKCRNIKSIAENHNSSTGVKCPVCGKGEITAKKSRRGLFYACNQYPDCKTAFWGKPTGEKCPDCGSLLIEDKKGGVKCSKKGCKYKKESDKKE
ncbi:type I DNA topoisomerase [Candidatus Falkowbacteria bacterium]|nr:type I DNA topoisomerase [Candidatus Falkowbacteria bacterium]